MTTQAISENASTMNSELLHECIVCNSQMLDVLDPQCNIAQCRSCGFIFDNPRRRLSKIRAYKKPGSLLDVGTGIGQFLAIARTEYTAVYGTEVSSTAIAVAKEKYGLDLFQGTVDGLLAQGKTFDNVTLFHVLEHVPDPKSTLKVCHSLLAPGGCLVVAVPNEVYSLRGLKHRVFSKLRSGNNGASLGLPRLTLDGSISEIHLSHFSVSVLARLMRETGFEIVSNTLDPYYVRAGLLRRLKADFYYYACALFQLMFRVNIYDAIFMIGRKLPSSADAGTVVEPGR